MDAVRQIANAVLYEGYILWPYRRSALKNQRRFTFGGVYPRTHSETHPDDPWRMRTECLVEGDAPQVDVRVRFLHVVERQIVDAQREPVDELTIDGERHLSWQEAVERQIDAEGPFSIAAGRAEEALGDGATIVRSWQPLRGAVEVGAERIAVGLMRVSVEILNTTPLEATGREDALRRTLCSTHTVLHATGGTFVSLTDPPAALRDAAEACRNEGTWPVLVGEPGARDTLLSSPIILDDHPRIAPESPGDLFDGGEIDALLTLNILSLTDEEKAEMRDTDPRVREILERTEALSADELLRPHGAIRDFRVVR